MAGRDEDAVRHDLHPLFGQYRMPAGCGLHLSGEYRHEALGQVLGDEDGQVERGRQPAQEQVERMDSAGGGPDGDDLRALGRMPPRRRNRRRTGGRPWRGGLATQRADLAEQAAAVILVETAGSRLEHGVGGTHLQRRHRRFGTVGGERGDDEHLSADRSLENHR